MKRLFTFLFPVALGLLLLPVPLLREFHFESAMLAGIVGTFLGGWKAATKNMRLYTQLGLKLIVQTALFGLPLFVLSFINQCLSFDGVAFWMLVPGPSIFFGIAIGRFFKLLKFPFPRLLTVVIILFVGLILTIIEAFHLPQVYFYNHVWGMWPGPIYDQEVTVSMSLVYYRGITLLWIWLLWMLPSWYRTHHQKKRIAFTLFLLMLSFYFRPELGINSPASYLQQQLHHTKQTEHFNLYFDAELYTEKEIEYWAARHEFHFNQISEILEIEWPEGRKIDAYLYAHAWQKKKLVGAKFTSYVPVWLQQDQLHIAKEHLDGVLKHELVHVLAKQFGNNLTNASWSIGLVEGVAEAIAADASEVSTLNQIMAAEQPFPTAADMRAALTFSGFYTNAGGISYTTAGSFVQFLLLNYPVENLKQAYRESSFKNAYSVPFETLVEQWHQQLPIKNIDALDSETSRMIFAQRSVFQVSCPHTLSPILKSWDTVNKLERSNDSTAALITLDALYKEHPDLNAIKQKWKDYQLNLGNPEAVVQSFSDTDSVAAFQLVKADALMMTGNIVAAQILYNQTSTFADSSNQMLLESLEVRSTPLFWNTFMNLRYRSVFPTVEIFTELPIPLKWLGIIRAIEHQHDAALVIYMQHEISQEIDYAWFNTQLQAIDRLAFIGEYQLAQDWINKLRASELRIRFEERLTQKEEWVEFLLSAE